MQKISVDEIIKIKGFSNATINGLYPFSTVKEIAVTLHYPDREDHYTVELSPLNQPIFTGWLLRKGNL